MLLLGGILLAIFVLPSPWGILAIVAGRRIGRLFDENSTRPFNATQAVSPCADIVASSTLRVTPPHVAQSFLMNLETASKPRFHSFASVPNTCTESVCGKRSVM